MSINCNSHLCGVFTHRPAIFLLPTRSVIVSETDVAILIVPVRMDKLLIGSNGLVDQTDYFDVSYFYWRFDGLPTGGAGIGVLVSNCF